MKVIYIRMHPLSKQTVHNVPIIVLRDAINKTYVSTSYINMITFVNHLLTTTLRVNI